MRRVAKVFGFVLLAAAFLFVVGFMAANQEPALDDPIQAEKPADLESELERLQAENEALRRAATERQRPRAASSPAKKRVSKASAKPRSQSACYKDYCPCSQPQEGMDSVLCDQLEAGVQVPIESMIAGRGGREYRRQMATGDYDF
jgi:hypothetical protein